ncbi:hypothetical protein IQ243_03360 [Nostocales cyanobacterium LEGE 11386]|nr:hypothetical protein [Nostocales cyanobacterium LEGE 11386]
MSKITPEFDITQVVDAELSKLNKSVKSIESSLELIQLLRLVGYGLLLLAFFDLVEMFIPPNFMNPAWEFQTMGQLVEKVAVPLIGLVFVFSGKRDKRGVWETRFVALLSYLTLLVGLLFILTIPWGIVNTIRLHNTNVNQVNTQSTQQVSQIEQVENQLKQATPTEIENFLTSQNRSLEGRNPQEIKDQILSELAQSKQRIKTQTAATKASGRLRLFKSSVKWNLGALVSAALFISLWKGTVWARRKA